MIEPIREVQFSVAVRCGNKNAPVLYAEANEKVQLEFDDVSNRLIITDLIRNNAKTYVFTSNIQYMKPYEQSIAATKAPSVKGTGKPQTKNAE